jgi:ABC-2 type transport system permease protein
MMSTYLRCELLRTVRNRRMFMFSLGMPLLLFGLVAAPNRHETLGGIPFATYYMTGMISWGSTTAVLAGGARIAMERAVGWNRQLRTTPLRPRAYLGGKVASGYVMAAATIAALAGAGTLSGVRLGAWRWVELVALTLVGLVPFAALGVALGHVLRADSLGPAMGGTTAVFAVLGGAWGPIAPSGFLHTLGVSLPSYWLVQVGRLALTGRLWPAQGWAVIIVWTIVLVGLAVTAYRKDTGRE